MNHDRHIILAAVAVIIAASLVIGVQLCRIGHPRDFDIGRPVAPAALAAGTVSTTALPPGVSANPDLPTWGSYSWDGGVAVPGVAAFWVIDETADAGTSAALRAWVDWLDAYRAAHNPHLPYAAYARVAPGTLPCKWWQTPGWSFLTVCTQNVGAALGGVAWVDAFTGRGTPNQDWQPVVIINPFVVAPELVPVEVAHEMGHALGLPHVSDCAEMMGGGEWGCRLTTGPRGYTAADLAQLDRLYP